VAQLMNLRSPETAEAANAFILELIASQTTKALQMCVAVIDAGDAPPLAVKHSLVIIKTMFSPRLSLPLFLLKQRWHQFSADARAGIQGAIMRGLVLDDAVARNIAAVCLALVAQLDWSAAAAGATWRPYPRPFRAMRP